MSFLSNNHAKYGFRVDLCVSTQTDINTTKSINIFLQGEAYCVKHRSFQRALFIEKPQFIGYQYDQSPLKQKELLFKL